MSDPIPPSAILETCLSVSDLPRAIAFYTRVFGYSVMAQDERFCAMSVKDRQVLLLFLRGNEFMDIVLPFGTIPHHGASGASHIGFSIPSDSLKEWLARLEKLGVPVESSFQWPLGGTSVYFRDPDGHLLELLTPGIWPMY